MEEEFATRDLYVRHKVLSREMRENLRLYMQTNKDPDMKEFFKEVNKNRPINITEESNVGKAYSLVYDAIEYLNRHMDAQGLELIEKTLRLDPENEEALFIKMDVLADYKRFEEAEACAEKLISIEALNPFIYAEAYFTKSTTLLFNAFRRKDRQLCLKALECTDEGLACDGGNYDLVVQKAGILYQLSRREYRKWIEKAYKIDRKRTEMFMEHYWIKEKLI